MDNNETNNNFFNGEVAQPAVETPVEPAIEATPAVEVLAESAIEATSAVEAPVEPAVEATPAEEAPVEPAVEATPAEEAPVEPAVEATPAVETPVEPAVVATPAVEVPVEPVMDATPVASDKKNNKIGIIIAVVIIAVIIGVVILLMGGKDKKSDKDFDINYSTSFFIKDENDKYGLFDEDGKKLVDFIYDYSTDFVNGSALVRKDDQYAVINSNGKEVIPFGKYKRISESAGLYKAYTEDGNYVLVDGKGKVLYDLEDIDVSTYIGEDLYSILKDSKNKKYYVINFEGKVMATFDIANDDSKKPSTNQSDNYMSAFYNGKNFILNPITGKEIVSFDNSKHYCVNNVKNDGKLIMLNSCADSWFSNDDTTYAVVKDGKFIDLSSKCDRVTYIDDVIECIKDSKYYILDSDMNLGFETYQKAYLDSKNYASKKEDVFDGIDFYSDGKMVKNVECRKISETGYSRNGLFVLGTYYSRECNTESGYYEYYNSKGEKMFDKSFQRADKFDKNGLAKVSEDRLKYYLIDTKGNKLSNEYKTISTYGEYYISYGEDNNKGIIGKDGKDLLEAKYSGIDVYEKNKKNFARLKVSDNSYTIYNLDDKKEIITLEGSVSLYDHYIQVSKDDKTSYYTYSGKMFYERNN